MVGVSASTVEVEVDDDDNAVTRKTQGEVILGMISNSTWADLIGSRVLLAHNSIVEVDGETGAVIEAETFGAFYVYQPSGDRTDPLLIGNYENDFTGYIWTDGAQHGQGD